MQTQNNSETLINEHFGNLHPTLSALLIFEYNRRIKKNPRYSLRAFARDMEIDASSLSKYMTGRRLPSNKMIKIFCAKLNVTYEQEKILLKSINLNALKTTEEFQLIELEAFHAIADWYHIAILELICTKNFKSNTHFVAKRLGISGAEAQLALDRLERLGLIKLENGTYTKTKKNLSNFSPGVTSKAHKEYQRQIIYKAIDCIDDCPPELKDITSISMAINIAKLQEARALITEFRKKMCQFLEDGDQTEVYNLSIQLSPVSCINQGEEP